MNRLLTYDVENTPEETWKEARDGYISKPQFEPSEVKKVSQAAAALCIWCVACSKYQQITKKVAPKKAKHREVIKILKEAQAELQSKLDRVASLKEKVYELDAECKEMQKEKEELVFEMDRSSKR